ncbi:phosphoglycerol transferase MdoB-like AlkP superfamily enzyme [Microbacterium sp. W4I4]|uniref:phage holin family protein n=1 Tax=Microbacterium sp. W4I4 TaxID=3042295 RepID=UPI00277F61EE|nr:phage holin family protein [Microbacterium sp. W4I4]MDQ0614976.1 phosphoglycerol transferase MdoB-like AlkP superfamily enzyme [Microbacterium sp. W4I4]
MARGNRDRADDSLLTLLGDLPELVRNLVTAEIAAAKVWVARTAKDAGFGSLWFVIVLFLLFWAIPVLLAFAIIGLASWWPAWVAALSVFGFLLLAVAIFALLGVLRFRKVVKRENPGQAVATDVQLMKEPDND